MAGSSRAAALLVALLMITMTPNSLSADAFAAAVPATTSASNSLAAAPVDTSVADESQLPSDVPLLPSSDSNDPTIPRIQLGGSISFDAIGPIIINSDGTTRTIDNWKELSPHEQQTAWRRIAKRNEERRNLLLLKQEEQGLASEKTSSEAAAGDETGEL